MFFLAEVLSIDFFNLILKDIQFGVVVISVVAIIEFLETWHVVDVVVTVLRATVRFAHTRIEWRDEGLARELNGMIEASDMV
jgi:hypothetical protein